MKTPKLLSSINIAILVTCVVLVLVALQHAPHPWTAVLGGLLGLIIAVCGYVASSIDTQRAKRDRIERARAACNEFRSQKRTRSLFIDPDWQPSDEAVEALPAPIRAYLETLEFESTNSALVQELFARDAEIDRLKYDAALRWAEITRLKAGQSA